MGISKLESFLERHIEGFFNKKFRSALEPPEVEKQVVREVGRRRRKNGQEHIVPNIYSVYMAVEDYQRLCSRRFLDDLHAAVEKETIRLDCLMDGRLHLTIEKDEDILPGTCDVRSVFQQEDKQPVCREQNTIVLDASHFKPPLNLPTGYKLASLTVLEGADLDAYLEFGEKQIYLGRREKNDFILTDVNASRMHAYIVFDRHRHILYDAESLNGTYLNGRRISSARLCFGDEIKIGNTVLLYEVI